MHNLKRITKITMATGLLIIFSTTPTFAQTQNNILKLTNQSESTIQLFNQENRDLTIDVNKIVGSLPNITNNLSIENLIIKEVSKEELSKPRLSNEEVAKLVLLGRYGNGQERKDKLESERYNVKEVQAEVAKIIVAGVNTKSSNVTRSHSTQSTSRSNANRSLQDKKMTMQATAYSTAQPELGRYTANGTDLHANPMVIAVDPKVIPLGTKVTVEGYGTYVAADTGRAIKGNRIDIHFKTVQECVNFGRRSVNVIVHK